MRKLQLSLISLSIVILFTKSVNSQDYHFTNYNYTHGLNLSNIQEFCVDSSGYLWMASNGGLARFDGIDFIEFKSDPNNKNTLPGTYITDVICTSSGKIYISCDYDGICLYNPFEENFTRLESPDDKLFNSNAALNLRVLNDSLVFVRTSTGQPYLINSYRDEIIKLDIDKRIKDIVTDPMDLQSFYIASDKLYKMNLENLEFETLANVNSFEIDIDDNGVIWMKEYAKRLCSFNPDNSILNYYTLPSTEVIERSMLIDNNLIWIATSEGCFLLNSENKNWRILKSNNDLISGLPSSYCSGLYKDKLDRIWIGHQQGISLLDPEDQAFISIPKEKVIKYTSAKRLDSTQYYLSSFYSNQIDLLNVEDQSLSQIWQRGENDSQIGISSLHEYPEGYTCIFYNGLYKTDSSFKTFEKLLGGKQNKFFFDSQSDIIWILDMQGKRLYDYHSNYGHQFNQVNNEEEYSAIAMQSDSTVWIGSSKGIYIIDKSGKLNTIPITVPNENQIPRKIRQFHFQDSLIWIVKDREALWKCTYDNGYFGIIKTYTGNDGLGSNRITDIGEDNQGRILATTPSGLSVYNEKNDKFINYDKNNGLRNEELIHGLDVIDDKVFLFGQELQYALTQNISSSSSELDVIIRSVRINQQKRVIKDYFDLNHGENNIGIDFIAILLNAPHEVQYRYRLHDQDEWELLTAKQSGLQLYDLNPGFYNVQIQARSKLSDWSPSKTIQFNIKRAFWTTWWFYALIIGLISFGSYLISKRRMNEVRTISKMKTKMAELENEALRAQMNPHFIFNSLNSIKSYIIHEKKEEAADYLTNFSELIRLVLSNSRNKLIPLEKEIEALDLYMDIENLRLDNKFSYQWNIDKRINTGSVAIPPLSIQPFVENAIWHGFVHKKDKGELTINIERLENKVLLEIIDNGVGRKMSAQIEKENKRRKSFGILLTKKRLSMDESGIQETNIQIIDLYDDEEKPRGTKIKILIPLIQL